MRRNEWFYATIYSQLRVWTRIQMQKKDYSDRDSGDLDDRKRNYIYKKNYNFSESVLKTENNFDWASRN